MIKFKQKDQFEGSLIQGIFEILAHWEPREGESPIHTAYNATKASERLEKIFEGLLLT